MRIPRSRHDFNCGGYALGTLDWYKPYSDHYDSMAEMMYNEDEDIYDDNAIKYQGTMVEYMLNTLDNIRIAKDEYDCGEGERIIAFRCGEHDYHFVRKENNGTFTHKMGSCRIEEMTRKHFYNPRGWGNEYNGPIVFLAIKDKEEDMWKRRDLYDNLKGEFPITLFKLLLKDG